MCEALLPKFGPKTKSLAPWGSALTGRLSCYCVHTDTLFIINEHASISNMARPATAADLDAYQPALQKWMPKAEIRLPAKLLARFGGVVTWRTAGGTIRYLVEEKRHLRHQDVAVIVDQLNRRRADLPTEHAEDRLLLLAPHVRAQQAAALERAEIDYLDLAGNVHLNAPGLFVHVEGRQPPKEPTTCPGRPQKGWIKAVMAILIRPDLVHAPYRALAAEAECPRHDCEVHERPGAQRAPAGTQGRPDDPDRQGLVALGHRPMSKGYAPSSERRFQVRAEDKPQISLSRRSRRARKPWALTGRRRGAVPISSGQTRPRLRTHPSNRRARRSEGPRRSTCRARWQPSDHRTPWPACGSSDGR